MSSESTNDKASDDNTIPEYQLYGHILARDSHSQGLPHYLISALERRGVNMARIGTTMPQVLVGLHHIWLAWEHAALHTVSEEVACIERRVLSELGIFVDAVLADQHAPANASGRSMLEAWALLRLFADHPEEIATWREISRKPGNTDFNFSRILRRIDEYRSLPKGVNAAEVSEYNAHSSSSHVTYVDEGSGAAPGTYLFHVLHLHDAYRHAWDFSTALSNLHDKQPSLFQPLPECPDPCLIFLVPPPPFIAGWEYVSSELREINDKIGLVMRDRGSFEWADHPLTTAYLREQGPGEQPQRPRSDADV